MGKSQNISQSLNEGLNSHALSGSSFGYSAVDLADLGASTYTLVTLVVDLSGSVSGYVDQIEKTIAAIVDANNLPQNPRRDNLLFRIITFNDVATELHGFKLSTTCNPADYTGKLSAYGSTALYEAAANAILAETDYAKDLKSNGYDSNGIVVIITDGEDNQGSRNGTTAGTVKKALGKAIKSEDLESLVSMVVALAPDNDPNSSFIQYLKQFQTDAGIGEFIFVKDVSPKGFAKLAQYISKSTSAQSQKVGSGGPSQPIAPGGSLTI